MKILKKLLHQVLPKPLFSLYHLLLARLAALCFWYPARKLTVILVTGTKGKSSTSEMLYRLLMGAGIQAALLSTIHFVIKEKAEKNLFKMTVPGRFFVQRFLARARKAGATHAVIEMSSEAIVQHRHLHTYPDAVVFTNLSPEHIEAHGGLAQYIAAKLKLRTLLEHSPKRPRHMVALGTDAVGRQFLEAKVERLLPYSLEDAAPATTDARGSRFFFRGELWNLPLPGTFNLLNALGALTLAESLGAPLPALKKTLADITNIPGRAERISRGQPFTVVVDYAHTADSLRAIYSAFPERKICVLGNTGGGRDAWKRPLMGSIADEYCAVSFLTDEDPYDEDPRAILAAMEKGFSRTTPRVILDRREAIRAALAEAREGDAVIITGKGTDPYIMRKGGAREPWSDKRVVEEELEKRGY